MRRMSATPDITALICSKWLRVVCAMIIASVVLPVPGGPHSRIDEKSLSASIARRSNRPGPMRSSCPTYSSNERARIRAAKGWLR